MADYLADFREWVRRGDGSQLRRERLLKKVDKFDRELKKVGGDVNKYPQAKFVEALCSDGYGDFEDLMRSLCFARLVRGDFSDWSGWEYRNEWAVTSYGPNVSKKRWRLEPISSLAVLGEQGIGDEIMFASCIPDLAGLEVVIECDPRLEAVFQRSFGVETRPRNDLVNREDPNVRYLDMERPEDKFLPIADLPRLFRKRLSDFPKKAYLTPLPEYVAKWSHLKGRTGLAWRGRTGQYKPEDFGIENPVLLQYDVLPFEESAGELPGCDLHNDIEDLFGICANLERVVSVPQTIVHIAGSIGTKVDVVLAPKGSSRVENAIPYRYTDPMPWYPNVRVHANVGSYRRSRSKS